MANLQMPTGRSVQQSHVDWLVVGWLIDTLVFVWLVV